jgi:hypothetical protein
LTGTPQPKPATSTTAPSPSASSSGTSAGITTYAATITTAPGATAGTTIYHVSVTNTGPNPGAPTCTFREGSTVVARALWRRATPLPAGQTWNITRTKPTPPTIPTVTCT